MLSAYNTINRGKKDAIKTFGVAVVLTVMAVLLNAGLNGTSFYPSLSDIKYSLTIQNASGSHYTLTVMSYVALLVPFVLAYIVYAWAAMDRVKITESEMNDLNEHHY